MYFTPVKRLFIRLEAGRALGKRRRGDAKETQDPEPKKRKDMTETSGNPVATRHTHGSAVPSTPGIARIALQHEDDSEDAIVITALDRVPFCCHEDLLTMPREKLEEVAASLNDRLPASMRIDVTPPRTDREIRKDIEVTVGITRNVPGAPKANKRKITATPTRNDKQAELITPFSSPLANKSRIYGVYTPSPGLGRLDEADEEEDYSQERRSKRRKVAAPSSLRNEIDDVFTSTGSSRPHLDVVQTTFTAASLRVHPTQSASYHNLPQAPSAQLRRKPRPTSQLVTSSSVAVQNTFLAPMQTSTPRRPRSTLGGSPLRSPLRSSRGNTKEMSMEDDPDAIALMSGMYGMRMCESYDGDFLDMDVDT
ncbi:hypothetical protein EYR36_011879 [Pleurotus pulmonarius]|nr:hypothetical protein EYR36_011879 [Pleurotus pulmonarius]KAF4607238.1 hypothetical protein EYR38_001299 [Pleurotus pulmonarius]